MDITNQAIEITGKVIAVLETRTGQSSKGSWASQDFVIEYAGANPQFPKHIVCNIFGEEKINQNKDLIVSGNTIKVSVDLDAREYQGRWFNSVRAWRVEAAATQVPGQIPVQNNPAPMAPGNSAPNAPQTTAAEGNTNNAEDDLPF